VSALLRSTCLKEVDFLLANKELFKEAYQGRKDKQFKYIWTSSGKTFLRRKGTSPVLPIMGMNDFVKIKG